MAGVQLASTRTNSSSIPLDNSSSVYAQDIRLCGRDSCVIQFEHIHLQF